MAQRCVTCSLTMNSVAQFEQHMTGKTHAKRLKLLAETGESGAPFKQINFIPAGGAGQSAQTQAATVATPGVGGAQPQSGMSTLDLFCELCMIKLNSAEQARIHYGGTKHQRKMRGTRQQYKAEAQAASNPEAEKNGIHHGSLFCGFCKISVNSPSQMDFHREGSNHKKMVEGMKRQMEGGSNPSQGASPAKRPTPPAQAHASAPPSFTTAPNMPTTHGYTYYPPPPPANTMGGAITHY